jgi:mannose-6-phosphate isomerase-like protein (cupin superfamily)
MSSIFPDPILKLPKADIRFNGLRAYLAQGIDHQIAFMEYDRDVNLTDHTHEAQWGIVLEGRIDLVINGVKKTYLKGDRYYIPKNVKHSGRVFAGYADMTFFDQRDRYKAR